MISAVVWAACFVWVTFPLVIMNATCPKRYGLRRR